MELAPAFRIDAAAALDPLITEHEHRATLTRFDSAAHRALGRIDPVPHVIDASQIAAVETLVACRLGLEMTGAERARRAAEAEELRPGRR